MSKRKRRLHTSFRSLAYRRRRVVLPIALVLSMVTAVAVVAHRRTLPVAIIESGAPATAATSSSAAQAPGLSLAKEYVHAGGKLVATEETPPVNDISNLRITGFTSSSATLAWNDNSTNEDGFQIVRDSPAQTFTVAPNVTTFTDFGLQSATTFGYVVRAFKGAYFSPGMGTAAATASPPCPTASTISGNGVAGYLEGSGSNARWSSPGGGVTGKDPATGLNTLFISDTNNHRIRKIVLEGPNVGTSSLVAGAGLPGYTEGNGVATNARYNYPRGMTAVLDGTGTVSVLYIADTSNNMIRKLTWSASNWTPSKLAGSPAVGATDSNNGQFAKFSGPKGVVVAPDGYVYVADTGNGKIRRVEQSQGGTTSVVSTGTFGSPLGITVSSGGLLYVSDSTVNKIYQVTTAGVVTAIAGSGTSGFADGTGIAASFSSPEQIVWANTGGEEVLFIADGNNNRIRRLVLSNSTVNTHAGSGVAGFADGSCTTAQFNGPRGVAFLGTLSAVFVMDSGNQRIRNLQ